MCLMHVSWEGGKFVHIGVFVICAVLSISDFDGFSGPSGRVTINATTGSKADVAIECHVRDANPPPQIRWRDGTGILTDISTDSQVHFLDNGRYLLITKLTTAQVNTNYHCEVTNARLHETVCSPTTYDLVPNLSNNEHMIYKRLINRTILVGETVKISYIAGAGSRVTEFGLIPNCEQSDNTLLTLVLSVTATRGVFSASIGIPSNELTPVTANSVTFEVTCTLAAGENIPSQATITVQGKVLKERM